MMEEEFYSTLKLTSGEEIVAKVCYLPEENSLLVEQPMLVEKLSQKKNGKSLVGFVLKEWINSTYDTLFVIKMEQVITMTELDKRVEKFYLNNLSSDYQEESSEDSIDIKPKNFSKRMGYLGSVKETKKFLEDIYKKS
jgi:hypothetical protein